MACEVIVRGMLGDYDEMKDGRSDVTNTRL